MRLKPDHNNRYFHPFEMAFSGFSNSGKTTLIKNLTSVLASEFDIGYFKHDGHNFQMNKEGKNTQVIKAAGAKTALINDARNYALLKDGELDQVDVRESFIDSDILFIEDHKHSELPKILIISEDSLPETLVEIKNNKISHIHAVITESPNDPFHGKYPHFQRDMRTEIKNFIIKTLKERIPSKINALILTGGKSKRMNIDKGGLHYHGEEDQISYTKNLLSQFCEKVYISCKDDQTKLDFIQGHDLILDSFPGEGPSTGILSAQSTDLQTPWLVLGCDLPYLEKETLEQLINSRNPFKNATCFLNSKRNWPEPLCTIYEPKSYHKLLKYFSHGKPCPRKVLFNSNIEALELKHTMALENVNTPDQREKALEYIQKNGAYYAN